MQGPAQTLSDASRNPTSPRISTSASIVRHPPKKKKTIFIFFYLFFLLSLCERVRPLPHTQKRAATACFSIVSAGDTQVCALTFWTCSTTAKPLDTRGKKRAACVCVPCVRVCRSSLVVLRHGYTEKCVNRRRAVIYSSASIMETCTLATTTWPDHLSFTRRTRALLRARYRCFFPFLFPFFFFPG